MVKNTGRPGYLQIADDLRAQIRAGTLAPGEALPSTTQLCRRYEVSTSVVKAAISVLRTEGLIIGQQGKGVFVRDRQPEPPAAPEGNTAPGEVVEQLTAIRAMLREMGDRIAELEAAVFPERRRAEQDGS